MEFHETVRARQSVREFKPDPVPSEVLLRLLEAFRAAPSWANVQPWELILVQDPELRRRLQQTLSPGNPATKAAVEAPVLVCAVGIAGRSGWYKGKPVTARNDEWMLFDLGIACEHLALAAAAEGLGTVHAGYFDFAKAGEILGVPVGRSVVELIPLGYPARLPRRVERKPLAEFVSLDRHGNPFPLPAAK
ncbi:MAG: nitroreductase family protein [Elusimicrobia bacterium]|nr:nitroreductase family protein [Elusimicrobiota bacterium]